MGEAHPCGVGYRMSMRWSLSLNLRIRKPLMSTRDRAVLCTWASSLWGGPSAATWARASNGERGEGGGPSPLPPLVGLASQGPWAPICMWESPSRRTPGIAKASSQRVPGSNPASAHPGQIGHRKSSGSSTEWRRRQAGPPLCIALCIASGLVAITVINLFSPTGRGSACTSAAPLSQSPSQWLARCPGCGQAAA